MSVSKLGEQTSGLFYMLAGVAGLEPAPKVLETSMLTIDTIPLKKSYEF